MTNTPTEIEDEDDSEGYTELFVGRSALPLKVRAEMCESTSSVCISLLLDMVNESILNDVVKKLIALTWGGSGENGDNPRKIALTILLDEAQTKAKVSLVVDDKETELQKYERVSVCTACLE